jgi:hypothetical protein
VPQRKATAGLPDSWRCEDPLAMRKSGAGLVPVGVKAMHQKHYFSSMLVLMFILFAAFRVQASTVSKFVSINETGHYEEFGFVSGITTDSIPILIGSPGTYKATLLDFEDPEPFGFLALDIKQNDTILGGRSGTGTFIFDVASVSGSDIFTAHLGAIPEDPEAGEGHYALQVAPIPIPPAFWLFLSAMIGIVSVARRGNGDQIPTKEYAIQPT